MSPHEIRDRLRRIPFQPFRVYLSDGSQYDVPHPELVFVTQTTIAIALEPADDDVPERAVYCDPLHITRVEPLTQQTAG